MGMTQMAQRNADVLMITATRKAVHAIVIDIADVETAAHAYVASGSGHDLDAYKAARAVVDADNRAAQDGAAKLNMSGEIAPLESFLQSVTSLWAKQVQAQQAGRHGDAVAIAADSGVNNVRASADAFAKSIETRVTQLDAAFDHAYHEALTLMIVLGT